MQMSLLLAAKSAVMDGQFSYCKDTAVGRIQCQVTGGGLARNVEVQSGEGGRLTMNW